MSTHDQPSKDEKVLGKLARLFVEIPDLSDQTEIEDELQAHGVDIVRLGLRIQELVESAAERERLAWLEEYRKASKERPVLSGPKRSLPKTREEKLLLLEKLQAGLAEKGLPIAVGFKKLRELSEQDLDRIITILQEEENPPEPR